MRARSGFGIVAAGLLALVSLGCHAMEDIPLTAAAAAGKDAQVMRLVAEGADVNGEDGNGWTPLIWAARNGRVETVALLARLGADLERRDNRNGWPPIVHAVHTGETGAVLALLDAGADVDGRSPGGTTALIMAAGYGNAQLVQELLARGADPWAATKGGIDALTSAVGGAWDIDRPRGRRCYPETVAALLASAPDLRLRKNVWGRIALHTAEKTECGGTLALLERAAQGAS